MAYKNKTYVCFDADNDMNMYNLMKAWKENENVAFNFHNAHNKNTISDNESEATIKRKLKDRLEDSKVMLVLVGSSTKSLYKYVRWEIKYAVDNNIPVIAVNLNKTNGIDRDLCPPIIRDELVIHVPYKQKAVDYALNNWINSYPKLKKDGKSGPYYYEQNKFE